jgi:hypothetical protein
MPALERFRQHSLQCLRMEADCMQQAGDLRRPAWQAHFLRMAREWHSLAERDPSVPNQTDEDPCPLLGG